jgi:hyperosmotically inducible protein
MDRRVSNFLSTGAVVLSLAAVPVPSALAMQQQSAVAGAAQQSNRSTDISTTRDIRRALIKHKSLSMRAHNVTIITQDGKVTLKGKVDSDAEKQTVESAAVSVAGPGNVDDQLTTSQ